MQAGRLASRLRGEAISAIHTSPQPRTCQTAAAIAAAAGLADPRIVPELDEVDFGSWSGRTFDDLDRDVAFRRWNEVRSFSRTPAGESMHDVQSRILRHMEAAAHELGDRTITLVSHADVIKAVVIYQLGLSIDAWQRFEVEPASITRIEVTGWAWKLLGLNEVVW
ncbi:phosphoglycerate mutase [Chelatococcus reniformis]|uniref:Phosphoglycerate mutase n=1 Tax=Chelatococcus reniformis TaxID=1494448 RepID=A0A916UMC2_9HYPH|nr:phosphoglycerate mutase [Chelatococcus reniformis]